MHRQVVDIPMRTNSASLVAYFSYCSEMHFMLSVSPITQTTVAKAFNMTSRYLDYIFTIDSAFAHDWISLTADIPSPDPI